MELLLAGGSIENLELQRDLMVYQASDSLIPSNLFARVLCFPHQTDFYFSPPSLVAGGTAKVRQTARQLLRSCNLLRL